MTKTLQIFLNLLFGAKLATDGVFGQKTFAAKSEAEKRLQELFLSKTGSKHYTGLLAIRCKDEFDNLATDFLAWIEKGSIANVVTCSTRAGNFYVYNPISYGGITGTAVLKEGYYPKTWLGSWQTRFGFRSFELLQSKPVIIYRDGNKNTKLDRDITQTGMFGINIHTAGWNNLIDRWSAGCLVVPKSEWDIFANLYLKAGQLYDLLLLHKNELLN